MQSARQTALRLLDSTERSGEYSNIALDSELKRSGLSDVDRRFVSALYYGVLERRLTLDAVIEKYSSRPSEKLSLSIRQILRLGIYQLLYMDSVPDSAAVNESVKLAGGIKNGAAAGYVNALLRGFIRSGKEIPKSGVKLKDLSVEYSCPEWIVKSFIRDFGEERTAEILKTTLMRAPLTARLNTARFKLDEILDELSAQNVAVKLSNFTDSCADLSPCGPIEELTAYKKGMLHIQDLSCQLCCRELGAEEGETVIDFCSAPGGKAFTVAEMMNDRGRLLAFDLHPNRVRLIESGAKRLGLTSISAAVNNAKAVNPDIPPADRILCDVPCSGLGVIRRKPEIKYRPESAYAALPEVQYEILSASSEKLKAGGTLIYSTCTLRREENAEVVEKFLSEHPGFEPVKLSGFTGWNVTITPEMFGSDGFFIAKLTRKR